MIADCLYLLFFIEKKPPSSWPSNGRVQFDRMFLRYSENDEPVLKDISCSINANEKVCILIY